MAEIATGGLDRLTSGGICSMRKILRRSFLEKAMSEGKWIMDVKKKSEGSCTSGRLV
jgi:hypothetical protein